MRILISILLLTACGGPLIEPGKYLVSATNISSTDPTEIVGEQSDATWTLSENDGDYKLDLDNGIVLDGKEDGDIISFNLYKAPLFCVSDFVHLHTDIAPTKKGFKGNASQEINFCNYYNPDTNEERMMNWATYFTVKGTAE